MANDHAGVAFKSELQKQLSKTLDNSFAITDLGCSDADGSVDYPVYSKKLSQFVLKNQGSLGIAICGSGLGVCMACNRFKGIRAALIYDLESAGLAKKHNNANVLCFGARKTNVESAVMFVFEFLKQTFEKGRHEKRIQLLDELND